MIVEAHYKTLILLVILSICVYFTYFVDFNKTEAKLIRFRGLVKELTLLLCPCTRRKLAQVGMPIIF